MHVQPCNLPPVSYRSKNHPRISPTHVSSTFIFRYIKDANAFHYLAPTVAYIQVSLKSLLLDYIRKVSTIHGNLLGLFIMADWTKSLALGQLSDTSL